MYIYIYIYTYIYIHIYICNFTERLIKYLFSFSFFFVGALKHILIAFVLWMFLGRKPRTDS